MVEKPSGESHGKRQRRISLFLLFAAVAVGIWAAVVLWPYAKARVYDYRIRRNQNPQGNLVALAQMKNSAAIPLLEDHARYSIRRGRAERGAPGRPRTHRDPFQEQGNLAVRLLRRYYPESRIPRGMQEYEEIVGHPYEGHFWFYGWSRRKPADLQRARGLRGWLQRYPRHPGADDALYWIATSIVKTEPIEALRTLYRAASAPDGDKRPLIANWFQRVLERHATEAQLDAWVRSDCPESLLDNVLYVIAVKRMRKHDFSGALKAFGLSRSHRRREGPELAGRFGNRYEGGEWIRYKAIDGQIDECRWFARKKAELSRLKSPESKAAVLHAMGRRCFHNGDIFHNVYYYQVILPHEVLGSLSRQDIGLANRYRQAGDFFESIVREYPSYSKLADVEYSIPLCLLRLRRDWPRTLGAQLDGAIAAGFHAFAAMFPQSTMADDALFAAGIHHWLASHKKDTSTVRGDMKRIVRYYPDGDVIQRYGKSNVWLRSAIAGERDRRLQALWRVAVHVCEPICRLTRRASKALGADKALVRVQERNFDRDPRPNEPSGSATGVLNSRTQLVHRPAGGDGPAQGQADD